MFPKARNDRCEDIGNIPQTQAYVNMYMFIIVVCLPLQHSFLPSPFSSIFHLSLFFRQSNRNLSLVYFASHTFFTRGDSPRRGQPANFQGLWGLCWSRAEWLCHRIRREQQSAEHSSAASKLPKFRFPISKSEMPRFRVKIFSIVHPTHCLLFVLFDRSSINSNCRDNSLSLSLSFVDHFVLRFISQTFSFTGETRFFHVGAVSHATRASFSKLESYKRERERERARESAVTCTLKCSLYSPNSSSNLPFPDRILKRILGRVFLHSLFPGGG